MIDLIIFNAIMMSKKCKYAIKALIVLSKEQKREPILIADLAIKEKIPKKFLETILLELKRYGWLNSKKGQGGGYYLSADPKKIMLSDVFRLMNGPIALTSCASLNYYERCEDCPDERACGIKYLSIQVRDASLNILNKTSIADLAKKEKKK